MGGGGANTTGAPLQCAIHFFSYYIFTDFENFICLAWVVKTFEGPVGGGLSNCGTSN